MDKKIRLRKAEKSDCKDLWLWRNDFEVRKWSFSQKEISYQDHRQWFLARIKDPAVFIYIGEDQNCRKLGQVRFEPDGSGQSRISINLNPELMGKGYGPLLISEASSAYLSAQSRCLEIRAEIMAENIVSQKAFVKAGYLPQTGVAAKNRDRLFYVYSRAQEKGE